jgi:RNA polymerase sigma factor (sigma-70 family)
MARYQSPEPREGHVPAELDLDLLQRTQAYFQKRKTGVEPSHEESEAFDRFYDLFNPKLESYVRVCRLSPEDAEDCLQEAWTKIVGAISGFVSDGTQKGFLSWIRTIARNTAAKIRRYGSRHPTQALNEQEDAGQAGDRSETMAEFEKMCAVETVNRVLQYLKTKLPPLTFQALEKHFLGEETIEQIAVELNLTPHAVSWRISEAKDKFRWYCEHLHSGGGRRLFQFLEDLRMSPASFVGIP